MIDSLSSSGQPVSGRMSTAALGAVGSFELPGIGADARSAARARDAFAAWLSNGFELDVTRRSDVVLAVNEALANAAEYAYVGAGTPGTFDLCAEHDAGTSTLTVTVTDRGRWRPPPPEGADRTRGRGIPLMEALSDGSSFDHTSGGTVVMLRWHAVTTR